MKNKSCPFCGSKEMAWIDHEEGCYLRMMEEKENEENGITYSPTEFIDAWCKRPKKKNVKKIIGMSCNTCGELEDAFLYVDIDDFENIVYLDIKGDFHTLNEDLDKVHLTSKQIKNATFSAGVCCGECNDESEISVQFEDGHILCDEEAWEYYISELVD